jgi:molybdopterin/thiamine biosynthesis adenylyltransferase
MLKLSFEDLRLQQAAAREREIETCSIGLVYPAHSDRGQNDRYVVRQLLEVPEEAYAVRSATAVSLRPSFCVEVVNRARAARAGILLAHTHIGEQALQGFSHVDDAGEPPLAEYFGARLGVTHHFSAVFTGDGVQARRMGGRQLQPVVSVGPVLDMNNIQVGQSPAQYDRQVRAFGHEGQLALARLKVAIVGLGGTGSQVAQQLAHLGVTDFVLIDSDVVDVTNLNRLVGAVPGSVGMSKVSVAARHITLINPRARCIELFADVVDEQTALALSEVDFIFACTDSMASRAVLNQLAYQYLVPCIDMGVAVGVSDGQVRYISGRTQMLSPGIACLVCTEKLDAEQVRRELLTPEQRVRDPYIVGEAVPQPSVISLNSTVVAAAITMFLAAVTGVPSQARMVIYDGMRGSLRPAAMQPRPHCIVCSLDGALARGNAWRLPTRPERHDV